MAQAPVVPADDLARLVERPDRITADAVVPVLWRVLDDELAADAGQLDVIRRALQPRALDPRSGEVTARVITAVTALSHNDPKGAREILDSLVPCGTTTPSLLRSFGALTAFLHRCVAERREIPDATLTALVNFARTQEGEPWRLLADVLDQFQSGHLGWIQQALNDLDEYLGRRQQRQIAEEFKDGEGQVDAGEGQADVEVLEDVIGTYLVARTDFPKGFKYAQQLAELLMGEAMSEDPSIVLAVMSLCRQLTGDEGFRSALGVAFTNIETLGGDAAACARDVRAYLFSDNDEFVTAMSKWQVKGGRLQRAGHVTYVLGVPPLVAHLLEHGCDMTWLEQWFASQPLLVRLALPKHTESLVYERKEMSPRFSPGPHNVLICNPFQFGTRDPSRLRNKWVAPPMSGCPHSRLVHIANKGRTNGVRDTHHPEEAV
jgi:hypothetical protein